MMTRSPESPESPEDGSSLKFAYARNLTLMEKVELSCQARDLGLAMVSLILISKARWALRILFDYDDYIL